MKSVFFDFRGFTIAKEFLFDKKGNFVKEVLRIDTEPGRPFEVFGDEKFLDTLVELVNDAPSD